MVPSEVAIFLSRENKIFLRDETPDAFFGLGAQENDFVFSTKLFIASKRGKGKSCNNLKSGERSWVRGLVIRREGISTQRIYSTL